MTTFTTCIHEDWLEHIDKGATGIKVMASQQQNLAMEEGRRPVQWGDVNTGQLKIWLQREHDFCGHTSVVRTAVQTVADECHRNSLAEWLLGLKWDGVGRVDDWLRRVYGVDDKDHPTLLGRNARDIEIIRQRNSYHQFVSRYWFLASVARALNPGCKADMMVILVGQQGIGKSWGLRLLFGENRVVMPHYEIGSPKYFQSTADAWAIEFAELVGFGQADIKVVKGVITDQYDTYIPMYGHTAIEQPRRSLMFGTTNQDRFLRDSTGERRYLPVIVWKCDFDYIRENRVQLFAEAVHRYKAGETYFHLPEFIGNIYKVHKEREMWAGLIDDYLFGKVEIRVEDIVLVALRDIRPQPSLRKVTSELRLMGWVPDRQQSDRVWVKVADSSV